MDKIWVRRGVIGGLLLLPGVAFAATEAPGLCESICAWLPCCGM